ncbi:MAG: hypothetical protein R3E86_05565 [Pseudomonadales bacterium]
MHQFQLHSIRIGEKHGVVAGRAVILGGRVEHLDASLDQKLVKPGRTGRERIPASGVVLPYVRSFNQLPAEGDAALCVRLDDDMDIVRRHAGGGRDRPGQPGDLALELVRGGYLTLNEPDEDRTDTLFNATVFSVPAGSEKGELDPGAARTGVQGSAGPIGDSLHEIVWKIPGETYDFHVEYRHAVPSPERAFDSAPQKVGCAQSGRPSVASSQRCGQEACFEAQTEREAAYNRERSRASSVG